MRWPHVLDVTSPSYKNIKHRVPVRPCLGSACSSFQKHSIAHGCFSNVDPANAGSAAWIRFRRVAQAWGTACLWKISADPVCRLARTVDPITPLLDRGVDGSGTPWWPERTREAPRLRFLCLSSFQETAIAATKVLLQSSREAEFRHLAAQVSGARGWVRDQ